MAAAPRDVRQWIDLARQRARVQMFEELRDEGRRVGLPGVGLGHFYVWRRLLALLLLALLL